MSVLEHRKRSMQVKIAEITVKIVESKDDLEKCVQKQDYLQAQALKKSILALENDKQTLQNILLKQDSEELSFVLERMEEGVDVSMISCLVPVGDTREIRDASIDASYSEELDELPHSMSTSPADKAYESTNQQNDHVDE